MRPSIRPVSPLYGGNTGRIDVEPEFRKGQQAFRAPTTSHADHNDLRPRKDTLRENNNL